MQLSGSKQQIMGCLVSICLASPRPLYPSSPSLPQLLVPKQIIQGGLTGFVCTLNVDVLSINLRPLGTAQETWCGVVWCGAVSKAQSDRRARREGGGFGLTIASESSSLLAHPPLFMRPSAAALRHKLPSPPPRCASFCFFNHFHTSVDAEKKKVARARCVGNR